MQAIDLVRRMNAHRKWVNARLCDAAGQLTDAQRRRRFDIGHGSVHATLTHLYGAESAWLGALRGNPDAPLCRDDQFETFEQLTTAWTALRQDWDRYLAQLDDEALTRTITKRSTSSFPSLVIAIPASDVLMHVCTHAQYTTAQCANMFRRLGVSVPDTMLVTLSRLEHMEKPS